MGIRALCVRTVIPPVRCGDRNMANSEITSANPARKLFLVLST